MEYTLLRYQDTPTHLTALVATANPAVAVDLTRRWCDAHRDEGVIVTIGAAAVVHCPPGRHPTAGQQRRTARASLVH